MTCPRCGFSEPGPVECPRCGVVFAKLERPVRPARTLPAEVRSGPSRPRFSRLDTALLVAFAAAGAVIVSRWTQPPPVRRDAVPAPAPERSARALAQYLSGRRLGYRLDPSRAAARDGRMKVDDFYDSALAFVEYLIDRYRQASLNELLKHAGETGSVDQAFRRAFHQSYGETREEWIRQLK